MELMAIPELVTNTFPEDWQIVPLGRCGEVVMGQSPPGTSYNRRGEGSPLINGPTEFTERFPIKIQWTTQPARFCKEGDLLICVRGSSTGRINYADDTYAIGRGVAAIRARDDNDTQYLSYRVVAAVSDVLAKATGSTFPSVDGATFRSIAIPLPDTPEQRVIAAALSDVDALLEELDRLIAKKRDLKQAAMQQLLTGETRLPGFEGEWEDKQMEELVDVDSENLPISMPAEYEFNYISLEQVDAGRLRGWTEERFATAPSRARRTLRHDDVLMSTVRPNLMAHLHYQSQPPTAVCSTGFAVLRSKHGRAIPGYVFAHLFAHGVNKQIEKTLAGSNYPAISGRDVKQILLPCPPDVDEQAAIATVLSDMDAEMEALQQRRAKTADLKQAMMQELLTGRTRLVEPQVSQSEDASASQGGKGHNWAINEAVVIAALVNHFGSENYPLGRKRYTKLAYLLHRHAERKAEGYLKKAAGPYNPQTKYGGPERIAQENGYIKQHNGPKGHSGFIAADNIVQAEDYFDKWYGRDTLDWLNQFRFSKNDDLEVLTTVDMAVDELRSSGRSVDVGAVKGVIASHPEWEAKLDRPVFSDANIGKAIEQSEVLFGAAVSGGTYA